MPLQVRAKGEIERDNFSMLFDFYDWLVGASHNSDQEVQDDPCKHLTSTEVREQTPFDINCEGVSWSSLVPLHRKI